MPTYRVDLGYDGSNFYGFARNLDVRTVQEELEKSLATIFGHPIGVVCAGRTDAGVHARHQVISFTSDRSMDTRRIHRSITAMLGDEIVAYDAAIVPDDFSARFSATTRAYRYRILNGPKADPLRRHTTWHVGWELDFDAMNRAVQGFIGEHDFASFCRQRPNRETIRTIFHSEWVGQSDLMELHISAKAFCHQMVRAITGFCVDVGRGRRSADSVGAALLAVDRTGMPPVAPAHGLTLWEVLYD